MDFGIGTTLCRATESHGLLESSCSWFEGGRSRVSDRRSGVPHRRAAYFPRRRRNRFSQSGDDFLGIRPAGGLLRVRRGGQAHGPLFHRHLFHSRGFNGWQREHEVTSRKVPFETGAARYGEIARGRILGDDSGLLKMLFHREDHRLLGVHTIGTSATELIHIGQAVLGLGGGWTIS